MLVSEDLLRSYTQLAADIFNIVMKRPKIDIPHKLSMCGADMELQISPSFTNVIALGVGAIEAE